MIITDTKTKLLNCAQDLIQRVGINAMSYNDISKAVGIKKASIHYYFPKKDDLINELLCNCKTEYSEQYKKIANSELLYI
jgi:AcrR family transcriptional regulator